MESGPASRGRRRKGVPAPPRKTRITIYIDDDVLAWFRGKVGEARGYQSLLNRALREYIAREPLEATLRRVVREELARAEGRSTPQAYGLEKPRPALVADSDDAGAEYGASLKKRRRSRRGRS